MSAESAQNVREEIARELEARAEIWDRAAARMNDQQYRREARIRVTTFREAALIAREPVDGVVTGYLPGGSK